MKKIWNFFGSYKKYVYLGVIFVLIDVVLELAIPALMGNLIDIGIGNKDLNYIYKMGGLMTLFGLIAVGLGAGNIYFTSKSSHGMAYNMRKALMEKVMDFSAENTDKFSTASLITRLTSDVTMIQLAVMFSLRMLVRGPLILVFGYIMARRINAELSFIFVIAIPTILFGIYLVLRKVIPIFSVTQQKLDAVNQVVQENVSAQRVVKAFVRQKHEEEKFDEVNVDLMKTDLKALTTLTLILPMLMVVVDFATIAALWFGGIDVGGQVSGMGIGELNSFITYIFRILATFMPISMVMTRVGRSVASVRRIDEVLETTPTIHSKTDAVTAPVAEGRVVFEDVDFYYFETAEAKTLEHISLDFSAGTFNAIISSTGGGKTSLVNLIPRIYDVRSGRVLIDDIDVRDFDVEVLRESIGVVAQKNTLFSGTIRDNILWGHLGATDEDVFAAAKAAQAHDFIMSFPEGYDTWIEQGGSNVSGGQRQRLCIARALVKKPRILILDDSTSALDTATEANLQAAIRKEFADTTLIMIAQRMSSIEKADQIVVLDEGVISDVGTHDELLQNNHIYQEIYESQMQGVEG